MKHKKALIIICSVLFFLTALTSYLNRVLFPTLIKKIAVERIEDALKRKVEIGSIHFNWVRGFMIDKIKIYEKNPNGTVFAQADRVSFGIIFFPGFKHYRITIPFINVRSPSVHLIRTGENTWNFSDMYALPSAAKNEKTSPFEIAWGGITISDGKCLVDDVSAPRPWSEYFDNINLKLSLSYKGISYDFTADIPGKKGFVGATVYYQPVTKNTQAQIHLKNIDTASYLSLINIPDIHLNSGTVKETNLNINYTQDKTSAQGNVLMKDLNVTYHEQTFKGDSVQARVNDFEMSPGGISFKGKLQADNFSTSLDNKNLLIAASIKTDKLLFNLDEGIIKVSTTLNASGAKLILDNHKTIEADPQLELTLAMPLNAPQQLTYKGSITLSGAVIRGFAPVQSVDNVELDADFQNDEATINALSANILDTNVRVNGMVKNFKDPLLNITAEADELNLAKIKDLAPQVVDQYGLTFNGTSSVKVKFEGLASDPLAGKILAVASVKNGSAASNKFHQRIENITGTIEATPDSLQWREVTATYQGQKYTSLGSLENFKNPKILFTLNGPDIELKADLAKNNDLITINALTGKYLNAAFDSKGSITLLADKGPVFDINSNVSLLLENLKSIQPLNPTGTINMTADLKGTALDWKNYHLSATITSPVITLMGYSLTDIKISVDQDEGKVKNLTFDGKLYDGGVHAVGSLDLSAKGMPYDLALNIDSTDLHKLKMDSPLKMEEINGKFFLTTIAHGTVADFKNNLHATGSLAIRDGFLAEFNLFKGLLSILNDAMRLGQVEFTDVEGNFTIEDQKINTDNLRLKGPTVVLLGKGWVNFDQNCDLDVTVDLSSGIVPDIAHDVLNSLNIHIYDKINNPKFKKKISMPQVINTLLKNLLQ